MGIENRDYVRRDRSSGWSPGGVGGGGLVVIPWIIGICAVVVIANAASKQALNEWLDLEIADIWPRLQLWRLITYGFAHASGVSHVIFNMFALWLFGRYVEPVYGSREFLAFYLTAILVSGLGFLALDAGFATGRACVGASGGVMAVTLLTACHFPRERIYIYLLFPIELWLLAAITVFIDLVGVLEGGVGIAHGAHLAGAAFGFLYHRFDWRITRGLGRIPLPSLAGLRRWRHRRKAPVRIYEPPEERTEKIISADTIDRLLQKIGEQGEASLTEEERAIMTEASRQAARRRQRPE